jgi:phosphate-selective porin OprO and OprP
MFTLPLPAVLTSHTKVKLLSAVALGALMGVNISTARADDTREEIRQLKAEIKRLEEKVARQEQQVRGIAKNPKMPPVAEEPLVCKDPPCPPPPPPDFVSFANGLQVDSWDGAFSFRIGGRVLVDEGVNSQPVEVFTPSGITLPAGVRPYFPSHPGSGFSNQVGMRQVRLEVLGKAFHDWEYKFQYHFNGAPNGLTVGGIRDAYLAWRSFMPVTFQTGYFFEPDGLERSASSTKYRDFIERSGAGELMGGNRHIDLAAVTGGDAPSLLGKPNWNLEGGIFSTSLEDGAPTTESATTDAAGLVTGVNFGTPAGSFSFLGPVPGGHNIGMRQQGSLMRQS